jgi:hypothetical protein
VLELAAVPRPEAAVVGSWLLEVVEQLVVCCVVCVLMMPVSRWYCSGHACLLEVGSTVCIMLCARPLPRSLVCLQVLTDLRRLGGAMVAMEGRGSWSLS